MQHRAHGKPVRALPMLWASYLMGRLGTDETGLNQTLPFAPDPATPFVFMNPKRCYPRKGVPKLFERITREGHWPDQKSYADPDFPDDPNKKFNLADRIECHLPGSKDWLFVDQRSAALHLPLDEARVQQALDTRLNALGLQRMHPLTSLVMLLIAEGENRDAMLEGTWLQMARSAEPAQVNVLMLFWQEALCQHNAWASSKLEQHCKLAWEKLLERKELQKCEELLTKIKGELERLFLHMASSAVVGVQPGWDSRRPECLVWRAPPQAAEIDRTLGRFYWQRVVELAAGDRAKRDALPREVKDAALIAFEHVLKASKCLPGSQQFEAPGAKEDSSTSRLGAMTQ